MAGFLYKPSDVLAVRTHGGHVLAPKVSDISDGRVVIDKMEVLRQTEQHGAVWGVQGVWDGEAFRGFYVESGALYREDETLPSWLERVIDALI